MKLVLISVNPNTGAPALRITRITQNVLDEKKTTLCTKSAEKHPVWWTSFLFQKSSRDGQKETAHLSASASGLELVVGGRRGSQDTRSDGIRRGKKGGSFKNKNIDTPTTAPPPGFCYNTLQDTQVEVDNKKKQLAYRTEETTVEKGVEIEDGLRGGGEFPVCCCWIGKIQQHYYY